MKKLLFLLMLSVAFALTANAQIPKQFMFGEDGGKTAGGDNIWVGHDLKIKADGSASLSANGFQTEKDLICTAKSVGSKVMIYFTLYNADGVNTLTKYKGGDLLLTLEYKTVKGKKVLWTTFGKYEPSVITPKKGGGVYFKK
jgi:Family of unknown function (DUF5991)